jgi:hypothetical protein
MSHQRILDHTGRQLAEIELAELWNRVGLCVGIARGELHRILLEGAAGVPMGLNATVTALSQQDGEVDITGTLKEGMLVNLAYAQSIGDSRNAI